MEENRKFGKPRHRFTNAPRMVFPMPRKGVIQSLPQKNKGQWSEIVSYLLRLEDVSKSICAGCGKAILRDKNNKAYNISRTNTLEEVKNIVEEIRKVNAKEE